MGTRRILVKGVALLSGLAVLSACGGSAAPLGDLTYDEYTTAAASARQEIAHDHATVTGATVRVRRGTPPDSSATGPGCDAGRLLDIRIAGSFPEMVISPAFRAKPEDMVITAVLLTVDAETGEVCRQGAHVGDFEPRARDVVLDLDARPLGDLDG